MNSEIIPRQLILKLTETVQVLIYQMQNTLLLNSDYKIIQHRLDSGS